MIPKQDMAFRIPVEWPSLAAGQRFQGLVYIEKEGFEPQLNEGQIAELFDVAILSCKGQSVVAARKLVDEVCRVDGGVPLFVVHDFDKAGFEICQRLTSVSERAEANDTVKYFFQNDINVIDLGLRLEDVEQYDLKSEYAGFIKAFPDDSICTDAEKDYLRRGRRVELNAFTAPQFIEWLTSKLRQHLPQRMVPADDVLDAAYRRAVAVAHLNTTLDDARAEAERLAEETAVPKTLRRQLVKRLKDSPEAWDKVLYEIARKNARPSA